MSKSPAVDGGLGHDVAARSVVALFGIHALDFASIAADNDLRALGQIIWARYICDAVELKLVSASRHRRIAGVHSRVLLSLIASHHRHANDKNRDAEMRHLHAVVTTTLRPKFLPHRELT